MTGCLWFKKYGFKFLAGDTGLSTVLISRLNLTGQSGVLPSLGTLHDSLAVCPTGCRMRVTALLLHVFLPTVREF